MQTASTGHRESPVTDRNCTGMPVRRITAVAAGSSVNDSFNLTDGAAGLSQHPHATASRSAAIASRADDGTDIYEMVAGLLTTAHLEEANAKYRLRRPYTTY